MSKIDSIAIHRAADVHNNTAESAKNHDPGAVT